MVSNGSTCSDYTAAMILDLCDPYGDIAPIFKFVTNVDGINQVGFAAKIVAHMTEAGIVGETLSELPLKTSMAILSLLVGLYTSNALDP